MSDLALDDLHDLSISGDGAFTLVHDAQYVRQALEIRLKHFRGEWFRDANTGTDWWEQILGKATDLSRRAELRRRILATPLVQALTRLDLTYDHARRITSVEFEVQLETGEPLEARFEVTS